MNRAAVTLLAVFLSFTIACTGGVPTQNGGGVQTELEGVDVAIENCRIQGGGSVNSRSGLSISEPWGNNQRMLHVVVSVKNITENKLVHMKGWYWNSRNESKPSVWLSDEHGNNYALLYPGRFGEIPTSIRTDTDKKNYRVFAEDDVSVKPGAEVYDIAVFESPVESATKFKLHLSNSNLGGKGITILQFDKSDIEPPKK